MTRRHFHTIIIGGGPAGMGAAISLLKDKAEVCVIDKAVFPRDKTCAGLVTAKTYRLIRALFGDENTDGIFCCSANTIRLFDRSELLTESALRQPVRLVNRRHFDNALVEEYKRNGGTMLEGEKDLKIDYEKNTVTLSDGEALSYDYLLFADGALSMAHKELRVDRRGLAFGIEAYIPARQLEVSSVDLYFGYLNSGYIWVFPHGETVCVGAADQFRRGADYRKLLTGFLSELGVDPRGVRYVGAFLPYGELIPQNRLPENVMLLGDAGGFTDPISGEGLYMSMQSGIYAAQALGTPSPKKAYLDSMEFISRTVRDGKKVQKAFYSFPIQKTFLKKVRGKNRLVAYFFEEMVDEYHYEYRSVKQLLADYKKSK